MRMQIVLPKGLCDDPVGTTVGLGKDIVGKVISYDKMSGKTFVDVNDDVISLLTSSNHVGISSRKI